MLTRIRNQAEIRDESQIFLPERKKNQPDLPHRDR